MKSTLLCIFALCLTGAIAQAGNLAFPKEGDPIVHVNVPDDWSPEFDEDGTLEAEDEDNEVYLALWELKEAADLENLGDDIDAMTEHYAKDVKTQGEAEEMEINGMKGVLIKATGKDKETDRAIEIEIVVFNPKKDKAAVLYLAYFTDAEKELIEKLVKVVTTLKPIKD